MKNVNSDTLSAELSDKILRQFIPIENPVFIDDIGRWYAGGGFYKLWKPEDGRKIITYSDRREAKSPQILVAKWEKEETVPDEACISAIENHARGYREDIFTRAVLKKTRHQEGGIGVDTYHSPHQQYQAAFKDRRVERLLKSVAVGADGLFSRWTPSFTLWPRDNHPTIIDTTISRKDAEIIVCTDFVDSLKRVFTHSHGTDHELQDSHPAHFYLGVARQVTGRLKKRIFPGLEKADGVKSLQETVHSVIEMMDKSPHGLTSLGVKLLQAVIELRSVFKGEAKEKIPGCLSAKDPIVRELSDASEYAYPLGGFLRPMKPGILSEASFIAQPVFGDLGFFTHLHRIPRFENDGIGGISEAYLGPTIGSTVRFYRNLEQKDKTDISENIGAIKIYRPDGLTVTIFKEQTKIWVSYDPMRKLVDDAAPIPAPLMEKLGQGSNIVELTRTDGQFNTRPLSFAEADLAFRDRFGETFRMPHSPEPGRRAELPPQILLQKKEL